MTKHFCHNYSLQEQGPIRVHRYSLSVRLTVWQDSGVLAWQLTTLDTIRSGQRSHFFASRFAVKLKSPQGWIRRKNRTTCICIFTNLPNAVEGNLTGNSNNFQHLSNTIKTDHRTYLYVLLLYTYSMILYTRCQLRNYTLSKPKNRSLSMDGIRYSKHVSQL